MGDEFEGGKSCGQFGGHLDSRGTDPRQRQMKKAPEVKVGMIMV
jgi:hypothetical protein